jgi:hypothetical protein
MEMEWSAVVMGQMPVYETLLGGGGEPCEGSVSRVAAAMHVP